MSRSVILMITAPLLLNTAPGCQRKTAPIGPPQEQVVPVSKPVSRLVTEYVDFTGRVNAIDTVNIIPRVTGYLVKISFEEGKEIKKGTLLFEIDPRPYKAQLDAAQAKWELAKASLKLAQVTNVRFKELAKKEASAVSQQDLDKYQAQEDEAVANRDLAKANLESSQLNLEWTKVYSPIDGKISRYYLTVGNLVNQDQTLLTTIVSLEPIYAFFDMDEPTYLRIKRAINEGRIKLPDDKAEVPVLMGMQGEDGYPHEGKINFIDNQVFPTTGSISWRGVFPNSKPAGGTRMLAPGMFVRIRLPIGEPHPALLAIDRAVWSDQNYKNVYVVDAKQKVSARRVTAGPLQEDGLRVLDGLKADDWVVVGALQQVRPGMVIRKEEIPMPTLGPANAGNNEQVPAKKADPAKSE